MSQLLPIKSQQKSLASNQHSATIECKKIDLDLILVFLLYSYDYSLLYLYMFCSTLLQRQRMKSMNHQSAFHFIYISVFLFHCISYFCSSVFLLHCKSLYFFAAQYSWRRGSKSLVQLLMLDKWSSPLGPLRTYTLIYFWSPPFISWNNSLKFSIYSNGKMMSQCEANWWPILSFVICRKRQESRYHDMWKLSSVFMSIYL